MLGDLNRPPLSSCNWSWWQDNIKTRLKDIICLSTLAIREGHSYFHVCKYRVMLDKPIEQITEADLRFLVDNAIPEQKDLEYKSELPGSQTSDKIKFLAEVSSLANTIGGTIIFGIGENDKHIPTSLDGVHVDDIDLITRRLEEIVRVGIGPRIPHLTTRPIKLSNDKYAILMRVGKSWAQPHMISLNDHGRFYGRSSAGKYPLDVGELRDAFGRSDALSSKIKWFIQERNGAIISEETPVRLEPGAKLICHFIPFSFADSSAAVDFRGRGEMMQMLRLSPRSGFFLNGNYNFDGFCAHREITDGFSEAYTQLFRNGVIETTYVIERNNETIYPDMIEDKVLTFADAYLPVLKDLSISSPIAVSITILGAKGYRKYRDYNADRSVPLIPITKEELHLPIIQFDEYGRDPRTLLRPAFDAFYNAIGEQRSLSYDKYGEWVRP